MRATAGASAVIAVGLTWREAVYCLILGTLTVTIPLVLNGAAGAFLHVPFPIVARSSFGFYFSRFAVIIRMITALFWHGEEPSRCVRTILTNDSYSDILRQHSHDRSDTRHLALLPEHTEPLTGVCWYNDTTDDIPLHLLLRPVSDLAYIAT